MFATKTVSLIVAHHQQDCQTRLRTKKPSTFNLHGSFICAGGAPGGGETCDGDGGGPLVCPIRRSSGETYMQVILWTFLHPLDSYYLKRFELVALGTI